MRNLILIVIVAAVILLVVPQGTVKNIPFLVDIKEFLNTQTSTAFDKWIKPTIESIIGDVFDTAEDAIQQEVQDTLNETEQNITDQL